MTCFFNVRARPLAGIAILGVALSTGCEADLPQPEPRMVEAAPPPAPHCSPSEPRVCAAECDQGKANACETLAESTAKNDPRSAEDLEARACDLGSSSACQKLRTMRRDRWRKACETGDVASCGSAMAEASEACRAESVGSKLHACDEKSSLESRASDHYCVSGAVATCEEACTAGITVTCRSLGDIYQSGTRTNADAKKALAAWQKACDGGLASACLDLGHKYEPDCPPKYSCLVIGARIVPEDSKRAAGYFDQACSMGSKGACRSLVELHYGGSPGVERGKLIAALRVLCHDDEHESCGKLRDLGEEP
jgi:TPR repeat protein